MARQRFSTARPVMRHHQVVVRACATGRWRSDRREQTALREWYWTVWVTGTVQRVGFRVEGILGAGETASAAVPAAPAHPHPWGPVT